MPTYRALSKPAPDSSNDNDHVRHPAESLPTHHSQHSELFWLQRTLGNQATLRLLGRQAPTHANTPNWVQRTRTAKTLIAPQESLEEQHQEAPDQTQSLTAPSISDIPEDETSRARSDAYQAALRQQETDRQCLIDYVEEGANSADRRLRNSCQWILRGKTKLYAITKTGDSMERSRQNGIESPPSIALFPKGEGEDVGHIFGEQARYNWQDLTDNTNVVLMDNDPPINGWNGEGYIAIVNPSQRDKELVLITIRHEIQHDADKNRDKTDALSSDDHLERLMEVYKTEYRAHSYEGGQFDSVANPNGLIMKYGYQWTNRQLAIFDHLWKNYEDVRFLWDVTNNTPEDSVSPLSGDNIALPITDEDYTEMKVSMQEIRQAIANYRDPDAEGFNKWNSVRVDDFYLALQAVPNNTNVGDNFDGWAQPLSSDQIAIQALLATIEALDPHDAQYILQESPDFTKLIDSKLDDTNHTRTKIRRLIAEQKTDDIVGA